MTAFPCSTASYHRKAEARLPAQSTPKLLRELRSLDFARFYGACTPPPSTNPHSFQRLNTTRPNSIHPFVSNTQKFARSPAASRTHYISHQHDAIVDVRSAARRPLPCQPSGHHHHHPHLPRRCFHHRTGEPRHLEPHLGQH